MAPITARISQALIIRVNLLPVRGLIPNQTRLEQQIVYGLIMSSSKRILDRAGVRGRMSAETYYFHYSRRGEHEPALSIVDRCGGLTLAAVPLGRYLMPSKPSQQEPPANIHDIIYGVNWQHP